MKSVSKSNTTDMAPFYVVANWKMNKSSREAKSYMVDFLPLVKDLKRVKVWLSVPFPAICAVKKIVDDNGSTIEVGAQNMNDARPGAFTGEVAAEMLRDEGCSFVLIGHSERRRYFNETDEMISAKVTRAVETGLVAVICVGESLEERESGTTNEVIRSQITTALKGVADIQKCMIAYEPIWAIGTGKSATASIVEETHREIRALLEELSSKYGADMPILYGGSVSKENSGELSHILNVNGFLVGTSSLQPVSFATLIQTCDV